MGFSKIKNSALDFGSGILTFFSFGQLVKVLDDFLERLNHFHPNSKLTHERSKEEINILNVTVRVNQGEFTSISTASLQRAISAFTLRHVTLVTQNLQLFLVRL